MKKYHQLPVIFALLALSILVCSCKKETTNPLPAESGLPKLTTGPLLQVNPVWAYCEAQMLSEGVEPTWVRGICWSTKPNPTVPEHLWPTNPPDDMFWNFNAVKGTGSFGFGADALKPQTKYYLRAFARNIAGTAYGNELSFTTPELKIGEDLFNGKVVHIDSTGRHGLIVSKNDFPMAVWYNGQYIKTEATSTTNGYDNTGTIVYAQKIEKQYAASHCFSFEANMYSHLWFLPAKDELDLLNKQASKIPGLSNSPYWSSTEYDEKQAWSQDLANGKQYVTDKATPLAVRAFRKF
jgi:hypothetical protein